MVSRKRIIVAIGGIISLIFLYLALRGQEWSKIVEAFGRADYRWLVPAGILLLADYVFRAWRWGVILKPAAGRKLSMGVLFPVLLLGFAANNVFPARAGELWRVWGLSSRTSVRKTVALSTLVVERVFDGFTLLFLLSLAGIVYPFTSYTNGIEYVVTALFMTVLLGMLLLLFYEAWTLRLANRMMFILPASLRDSILELIRRFTEGLHALRQPRALGGMIIGSLLAWGCQGLSFTAILLAFGFTLPPAQLFSVSILMLALINIIIMIPAGPGNIGTFEAAGFLALTIAGIAATDSEQALAMVLATHILQWMLVTGLGFVIAAHEGITVARLSTGPELTEG